MFQSSSDSAVAYAANTPDYPHHRRALPPTGRLARICSLWPFPVAALVEVQVARSSEGGCDDAGPSSFIT